MEERERMLDTIMIMQEFNIKKDKQIEGLEQENKALKDRWDKLKKWLISTLEEKRNSLKYYKLNDVLDKIQELEKGETSD